MTMSSMIPGQRLAILLILLMATSLAGCGDGEREEQVDETQSVVVDTVKLTPEQKALVHQAVTLANAIEKAPETMYKILEDYGLTADEYQSMVYRIAADPVLTSAYEEMRTQ